MAQCYMARLFFPKEAWSGLIWVKLHEKMNVDQNFTNMLFHHKIKQYPCLNSSTWKGAVFHLVSCGIVRFMIHFISSTEIELIILIMSESTLCVNFMLLLPSIDLGSFPPKVNLPEYRFLPKFAPESLPRCFTWVI